MNQRRERLETLALFLRKPAHEFLDRVKSKLGVTLLVVHAYRDARLQMALYQKGREYDREAGTWKIVSRAEMVTNAMPGKSAHNTVDAAGTPASLALDAIPLDAKGTAVWNYSSKLWEPIYEIAADCGFDPYGDKWGADMARDPGHFEEPGWKLKAPGLGLLLPTRLLPTGRA